MASWRDSILTEFGPTAPRLTLVADLDDLLLDEQIYHDLGQRGFDVVTVEDPIAFRYYYESRYRAAWDRGKPTERRLVVRAPKGEIAKLPYDLTQEGRSLTLGLSQLFPELNYPVLVALDRGDLDHLWAVRSAFAGKMLGNRATTDLALSNVFGIELGKIRNASDLLGLLFKLHRLGRPLPAILEARLLTQLRDQKKYVNWPFEQIVPRREAFLAFLQERWPAFLDQIDPNRPASVAEAQESFAYAYPGPAALPFDDRDLRAEIQALFLDGALRPVSYPGTVRPRDEWATIGIRLDPDADRIRRLTGLTERIASELPASDARYGDWIEFAQRWGELVVLENAGTGVKSSDLATQLNGLRKSVDARFFAWVIDRYGGLYSQPPTPVMVSHIPRALAAYRRQSGGKKIALVVLDGMAIDQWIVLREKLITLRPGLRFDQSAAFAWVPTITPVSRQALFGGLVPMSFPTTIDRTDRDASRWLTFWKGHDLADEQIDYLLLPYGQSSELTLVDAVLANPHLQALGLVVSTVDRLAHAAKLGKAGLHDDVARWVDGGFLVSLLDRLIARGFSVVLTSDHGNVEAAGIGSLPTGSLASTRGQRVRVYPSEILRNSGQAQAPRARPWPPVGLPSNYFALVAPDGAAFVPVGENIVAHGGISLEEIIVPYVVVRPEQT